MEHTTVRLTGYWPQLDGSPGVGSAQIVPSVDAITNLSGQAILTGRMKASLVDGRLSVDVPACDDPNLIPQGFTYSVLVTMRHAYWAVEGLILSTSTPTFDLSQAPAGQVVEYVNRSEFQAVSDALQVLESEPKISADSDGVPYFNRA